jgi:hypothetical protein
MNIQELDAYNLADAVKFNDRLNPRLWDLTEHLRPEVRGHLLKIAEDFREFLGVTDLNLKDITISGSNAAYTYTPNSDIDLHLVVNMPDDEVYRELFDAKKAQYNDQHNITIGGYDVELYVQDADAPHISQGIYSVLNNKWIQVPRRVKAAVDDTSTKNKFKTVGLQIERAIKSGNLERMDLLAKKIKKMRQTGLEKHGEFGPENLAFKILRSQGKIKELYDARNAAKDRELSLKEKAVPHPVKYGFKTPQIVEADPVALKEEPSIPTDEDILKDFIEFCVKELKLEQMPTIKLRKDPQWSVRNRTFGRYINDEHLLEVAWGHRHIMDVLRTVAHELTHKHQHERDGSRMGPDAGETGSPYENEANARAGILMRDYARLHPEYFAVGEIELDESASGYIPTKKQAKDPRWSMALTQDIRPGQLGKEANKLKLKTDSQGHPQLANPNGLFEELALQLAQFKEGIQAPVAKSRDEEAYYKFVKAKAALGRELTRKERDFLRSYAMFNQKVAESVEQLDEVRMAPSNLMQWATSPEAKGVRAGFEAELIFRDTQRDDDDDYEMEADYDMDERCHSIQQVIDFFGSGDYGMSSRALDRLQEQLDEAYMEWLDEEMIKDFKDEADDLIRKVLADEDDWDFDDEIQKQLTMQGISDDEMNEIIKAGERAPKFNTTKEQVLYAEANPLYDRYLDAQNEAEGLLDDLVKDEVRKQGAIWDAALDDFRDSYYIDDDSGFFDDVGLRWMSDVANNYDAEWPYMTGGNSGTGSRDWNEIGDSLNGVVDMPVKVSSGYHNATRREGQWIVEPDSSLQPDDSDDMGLEIVSPPMPLLMALEKLQAVTDWANSDAGNAYTNSSTGLHMGVSVPFKGGDVDYLKLILFLGDEYVLQKFGREANTYCKSAMSKFKENIKGGRADPAGALKLMQHGLLELAHKEIQKGVGDGKYTSAHIQNGYIEFRSPGGDWLAEENADPEVLQNTMLRFARAMSLAANPSEERREYAKKLYKLIAPEGDSEFALFSQFAAGELTAEQLKKRWAEKTIGTEKKMNQRWQLFQFDKIADQWLPVPGQSYNGYSEDEVKNRVWAKYGREALDSGEYELRNMSEDQQWEVYDVNTGETLEIVAGKNKGEVADKVYDKYVEQGIGFNVRPYEDPATMTPRAKLAKRIATKKPVDYNYEIVNLGDVNLGVVDRFHADSKQEADKTFDKWLEMKGLPNDTDTYGYRPRKQESEQATAPNGVPIWELVDRMSGTVLHNIADHTQREAWGEASRWLQSYGAEDFRTYAERFEIRPKMKNAQVKDIAPDVAQNFGNDPMSAYERNSDRIDAIRQDAINRVGSWSIYDVTLGREISRMTDVPWSQADARADELEQSTGHNMSVRGLSESVDAVSGTGAIARAIAGAKPPSPVPVRRKDPAVKLDIKNKPLDPYAQTYKKPVEEGYGQYTRINDPGIFPDGFLYLSNHAKHDRLPERGIDMDRVIDLCRQAGNQYSQKLRNLGDIQFVIKAPDDFGVGLVKYQTPDGHYRYLIKTAHNRLRYGPEEPVFRVNSLTETLPAKNLNQLYTIKRQLANPAFSTAEPAAAEKPVPARPAQPRVHTALADLQRQRDKVQQIMDLKQELETLTARAGRTRYGITPGLAADIEDIYPEPKSEADMDAMLQGYEIQKKKLTDYIARQRKVFPKESVEEGEVVPFRRPQAQSSLPQDVLHLANEWFWANDDTNTLQAVTDQGYGQGAENLVKYIQAQLQSKGWTIDFDDEIDNIVLTNRSGQTVALPVSDAYDGTGWATGTLSENFEDGRGPGRPGDSQRHGIPKGATMAELEKASHASGRKGQLARWQLNMRRGKKK